MPRRPWLITFIAVFMLLLIAPSSAAQTTSVRGTVVDRGGNPVAGANVVIPGTLFGTVTHADGVFAFENVRSGNYELKVFHADFVEASKSLVVESAPVDIIVTLRTSDADLSTFTLDQAFARTNDWRYAIASQTALGYLADRSTQIPYSSPFLFDPINSNRSGIISLSPAFASVDGLTAFLESLPTAGLVRQPASVDYLPQLDHTASISTATIAPDMFDVASLPARTSATLGYLTNAGGPFLAVHSGNSKGRGTYSVDGRFQEFTTDYSTGGSTEIEGGGRTMATNGWSSYRLNSQSMLAASIQMSGTTKLPVPTRMATLEKGFSGNYALNFRRALDGTVRFLDVAGTSQIKRTSWAFFDSSAVSPGGTEDTDDTEFGLESSIGLGDRNFVRLDVDGSIRQLNSHRTTILPDTSSFSISTIPDVRVVRASARTTFVTSVSEAIVTASAFAGATNISRDTGVDLGIVTASNKQYVSASASVAVSTRLTERWGFRTAIQHGVFAPDPSLVFANGVMVQLGQSTGTAFTELPENSHQSSVRIILDSDTRLSDILITGFLSREIDALTLTEVALRDDNVYRIDNADRWLGGLMAESVSSALDIVFLEINGRFLYGRNTSTDETIAGLPPHSVGTNLFIRSPRGGTFLRAASTRYFKRTNVSDRLGERQTSGAFVADIGAGYQKQRLVFEISINNIFDNTYWHHVASVVAGNDVRLAQPGRNLNTQLTYIF